LKSKILRKILISILDFLEAMVTRYIPVGFRIFLLIIGSYAFSSAVVVCLFLIMPFRTSENINIAIVLGFWLASFLIMIKYVSNKYLLGKVLMVCLLSFAFGEGSLNSLRRKYQQFEIDDQLKIAPVSVIVAEDDIDVMTEPSPKQSTNNKVLFHLYKNSSEIVEKKWATPEYTVYQLKFKDGKTGYIFSSDKFREIEKPVVGQFQMALYYI